MHETSDFNYERSQLCFTPNSYKTFKNKMIITLIEKVGFSMLKIMRFFLLLIALPLIGCGGSGDGGGEKGVDASPTLNYTEKFEGPKALAFTGNTTEQPSFALRLDGILLLIYAYTDAVGENLKIEKIVYETEEDGINTLFFGGNNLPNGFVSKDKTIEIQRYSFTETNYFATIEIASDSAVGREVRPGNISNKFKCNCFAVIFNRQRNSTSWLSKRLLCKNLYSVRTGSGGLLLRTEYYKLSRCN